MNAASPGAISLFLQNDYYASRDDYLAALADAMKEEYETIVAAGLDLQLDCPDRRFRGICYSGIYPMMNLSKLPIPMLTLNHALRDVDPDRVRVHICWGNYEGPHICDIDMDKVFSTLMNTRAAMFCLKHQIRAMPMNGRSSAIANLKFR